MSRRLRDKPRISYYEPEEPSLDEYVFCERCSDYVFEYCSIHGPLLVIPDDKIYDRNNKRSHVVDAADGNRSNWMRFVNCSRHWCEQNLVAYQYQGELYYRTIKIIPRFTELLVFYGGEFVNILRVNLATYNAPNGYAGKFGAPVPKKPRLTAQNYQETKVSPADNKKDPEKNQHNNCEKKNGLVKNTTGAPVRKKPRQTAQKHQETKADNMKGPEKNQHNNSEKKNGTKPLVINTTGKHKTQKGASLDDMKVTQQTKNDIRERTNGTQTSAKSTPGTTVPKRPLPATQKHQKLTAPDNMKAPDHINNNIDEDTSVQSEPLNTTTIGSTLLYKCTENNSKSDILNSPKVISDSKIIVNQTFKSGSQKLKPYLCDICDKCFSTKESLKIHFRIHTGDKPYQCDVCKKCFNQKSSLDTHKRIHSGEKPYQCDVCKKCCTQKANFVGHMLIHTGEKPYQCDVCKKCFNYKTNLVKHKRIHSGEKPYQCDVCKKCFNYKTNLVKHKRIHSGEKPYQCDVCKKCFNQKSSLVKHKRIHSGEKPYQCDICKKCFNQKSNLVKHKRIHSGEKPYQCDVCKKCFNQKSNLVKHKRIHSGEKPYQCDVCKKCFTDNANLVSHKRKH